MARVPLASGLLTGKLTAKPSFEADDHCAFNRHGEAFDCGETFSIDIHIEVPRVDYEKLSGNKVSETSESIRQRVQAARELQRVRFSNNGLSDIISNADMRIGEIRKFCQLQDEGQSLMRSATSCCA